LRWSGRLSPPRPNAIRVSGPTHRTVLQATPSIRCRDLLSWSRPYRRRCRGVERA
jgi:hypothetical protein